MANSLGYLLALRTVPGMRTIVKQTLGLWGCEIPFEVPVGPGFRLVHRGFGTKIDVDVVIGANVTIYHDVNIGSDHSWLVKDVPMMDRIEIGDDVIIFPGTKILAGPGVLRVGDGTILGADSVLTKSTGEWEVWAGNPARRIADRPPESVLVDPRRFTPERHGARSARRR